MNTSKAKTVKECWDQYAEALWGNRTISEVQHTETKKAFYAGAIIVFEIMVNVSCQGTEEQAIKALQAMLAEAQATVANELLKPRRN